MIATVYDIKVAAGNPNFPLRPWFSFVNSASSLRILNVPKKIGTWEIKNVYVDVHYPGDAIHSVEAVRTGGVYVATIPASEHTGIVANGYKVTASGIDENGESVQNYVLGSGDVEIMQLDRSVPAGTNAQCIHVFQTRPAAPTVGDAVIEDHVLKIWDGTSWISNLVSKTSQLTNDSGFITDADVDNTKILSKKTVISNPQVGDKYLDAKGDVYMYVVDTTFSDWSYSDSSTGHTLELHYNGVEWDWYDTGPDYGGTSMESWMTKEKAEQATSLSFDGFFADRTKSTSAGYWKKVSCFNQNGYDVFVREIKNGSIVLYFADGTTQQIKNGMTDIAHNVIRMTIGDFYRGKVISKTGFVPVGGKTYYFANKIPDIEGTPIAEQMDFYLTTPIYIDTFVTYYAYEVQNGTY